MTLTELLDRLHAKKNGSQWMALCPAHEDKNPSLSISEENRTILLKCHAGCATKDVLGAMGMTFEDLRQGPRIVATYDYCDEAGALLFQVVRYDPKNFKQRKPDGHDGWIWNLNGVRKVPYRLPELLLSENVLIVEGEKDVIKAQEFGLTATCNPGGAGKWKDEYSECLHGKHASPSFPIMTSPDANMPNKSPAH